MPRLSVAQLRDRQESILDAAEYVMVRGGFAEASIADVARKAAVSDGLIYRYFPGKQALRDAVLARFYQRVLRAAETAVAAEADFSARLLALIETHLTVLANDRALCRLFIAEVRVAAGYAGSALQGLNRRYTGILVKLLRQGMAEGEVVAGADPYLVRDMLYGGMEHLAWRGLTGGASLDVPRAAQRIHRLLLDGLAPERP